MVEATQPLHTDRPRERAASAPTTQRSSAAGQERSGLRDGPPRPAEAAPNPTGEDRLSRPAYSWDLLAAGGAMVAAAMLSLLPSSTALVWIGLMVLLVAPGYLLLQAMLGMPRGWHVFAGMGLSIPLIGLLALATALVPGGFQAGAIVTAVTLGVLGLGALAWLRRSRTAQPVS